MIYIEAINEINLTDGWPNVFLAGGITNCPDWQSELVDILRKKDVPANVFNPRRKDFPIGDPNAAREQITWEYEKLKIADIIIFWFSRGSLNPIVLYELGMWGNSSLDNTEIIVGIDPEYERKQDVVIQSSLAHNDKAKTFGYVESVADMAEELIKVVKEMS